MKPTTATMLLLALVVSACGNNSTPTVPAEQDLPAAEEAVEVAKPVDRNLEAYRRAFEQIKEFEKALVMFKMETGRYPDALTELTEAVGMHEQGLLARIPKDPWGNDYIYDPAGGTKRHYILICMGADDVEGTEDDLTNEYQPPAQQAR